MHLVMCLLNEYWLIGKGHWDRCMIDNERDTR